MAQEYAVMEKKLQELETQLQELFHHHNCLRHHHPDTVEGKDNEAFAIRRKQVLGKANDIKSKFLFLRKLLVVEKSSANIDESDRLQRVAERVGALEEEFEKWNDSSAAVPGEGVVELELFLPCDCTTACFEEDCGGENVVDRDSEEIGEARPQVDEAASDGSDHALLSRGETEEVVEGEEVKREERNRGLGFGCGVCMGCLLAAVAVAGIVVVVANGFLGEEEIGLLVPT